MFTSLIGVIKMALTDPLPNYDSIVMILLPFVILISISTGIYYIWRYRKKKATNTLLWGIGFTGVGIGMSIDYLIAYIFYEYFVLILPTIWDYSLFLHIGTLTMNFSLALSSFYGRIFKDQVKKVGRIVVSIISFVILVFLIINAFTMFDIFKIASWLTRFLGIWIVIFFTFISFKYKNYRALTITIGLLIAVIGGILMAQYSGTQLGLIGIFLFVASYVFLTYGLFYLRKKQE